MLKGQKDQGPLCSYELRPVSIYKRISKPLSLDRCSEENPQQLNKTIGQNLRNKWRLHREGQLEKKIEMMFLFQLNLYRSFLALPVQFMMTVNTYFQTAGPSSSVGRAPPVIRRSRVRSSGPAKLSFVKIDRPFSLYRWFKFGSCQLLAAGCALSTA